MYYYMYPFQKGRELTVFSERIRKLTIINASIALILIIIFFCIGNSNFISEHDIFFWDATFRRCYFECLCARLFYSFL